MINVNEEHKRLLGEVINFSINIQEVTISINIVVTKASSYVTIDKKIINILIEYNILSEKH
ncbi:18182_t:CDS:2 [Funneliformis geosporum]|uniref:18182_t:CDS:1 n=1 Tax=Funneliformis geosporum TaxID=1117311 RepID=A0A9W4WJW4_9GLOM|nr:18182_t:CDS:2 [Funneliformis geosporum]